MTTSASGRVFLGMSDEDDGRGVGLDIVHGERWDVITRIEAAEVTADRVIAELRHLGATVVSLSSDFDFAHELGPEWEAIRDAVTAAVSPAPLAMGR